MLRISNLSYAIDGRPLFEGASVTVPAGHRVGIVGRNGTGKTTLFRLIRGDIALDGGEIEVPKSWRIGGVRQETQGNDRSVLQNVLEADTEREELLARAASETDPEEIANIQLRLAEIDAWSAEARASRVLKGLGFTEEELARPASSFSGGWRMRMSLAGVLYSEPDLLLLDEPTNYLDLEAALWLESYLARYPKTVMIISHDRALLNRSVGSILHLREQKLQLYNVPYDGFRKQVAEQLAQATAAAKKQAAQRAHMQSFVDRFRAKATKARQAQSRLKMLEKMQSVEMPVRESNAVFTFPPPGELNAPIIAMDDVAAGYGETTILRRLSLRIDPDDRIALLGRNGEGKSTLAKTIAGDLPILRGDMLTSPKLKVGFFAQHQTESLDLEATPIAHIARVYPDWPPAKIRARLAGFGLTADQADLEVKHLSGGQKARLSLLLATIDAPHLLILDEPTNHLDIESREALVEALTAYDGAVILVSHDLHLLSLVADRLWLVKDGGVAPYEDDLDAYRKELLSSERTAMKAEKAAKPAKTPKAQASPAKPTASLSKLRNELQKCEARVETILEMQDKLAAKLADPALYEPERAQELETWNKKYAEVSEGLERAEALWVKAQEALETAEMAN